VVDEDVPLKVVLAQEYVMIVMLLTMNLPLQAYYYLTSLLAAIFGVVRSLEHVGLFYLRSPSCLSVVLFYLP